MQLPYHGRYAYSAIVDRPDYSWPDGKRLAVYLGLNIEHFAFGAGEGHLLTVAGAPPDPRTFAWRDYGNRVGVWRCLELFDELNLPAAHLINTAVFDYAPRYRRRSEGARRRVHRSRPHQRGAAQPHVGGRREAVPRGGPRAIARASGKPPRGWMAPWMASTHHTPDLLKEVGFDFLMDWPADDQPLWMKTRSGPLMSVPYPIEINDSPQILVRHHSPEQFRDFIIGQFEELLRQSAKQPLVCGIALHTMIVGQPYRLRMLREALQHIVNHPAKDKVWLPGRLRSTTIVPRCPKASFRRHKSSHLSTNILCVIAPFGRARQRRGREAAFPRRVFRVRGFEIVASSIEEGAGNAGRSTAPAILVG